MSYYIYSTRKYLCLKYYIWSGKRKIGQAEKLSKKLDQIQNKQKQLALDARKCLTRCDELLAEMRI